MTYIRSADQTLMREMNIALILECLRREAPLSRARLAAITGLTKATVSSLVQELLEAGFIREEGFSSGATGRPSIFIELNPEAGYILGTEIGVDFISVILTNFAAKVLWRMRQSTTDLNDHDSIIDRTVKMIQQTITSAPLNQRAILGLGLAIPGLVDVSSGVVLFAPNLGWRDVPLRSMLEAHFPFPIYVDNDANVAALGESYFGAGRTTENLLYVGFAVGVGAGIVINHRILTGATGLAGEVGHMTIDPNGPRCACGSCGCWEQYVSQWALYRRIRSAVTAGRTSLLVELTGGDMEKLNIPRIIEAARSGDEVALAALRETGNYIGLGLANLINAFNPQRVVLGGVLIQAHEFLLPEIQAVVQERAMHWIREAAEVSTASNGSDATVMGGIAAVYHRVLSQPLEVTRLTTSKYPDLKGGRTRTS